MPKLGKQPFVPDERDVTFKAVRQGAAASSLLRTPPRAFGFGRAVKDWGMLGNDKYGDCVWAGACHEHMVFSISAGHVVPKFTDDTALSDYAAATGFDPNDENTDQGTDVREAMKYRRDVGIVDASGKRHKIAAFVSVSPNDPEEILLASFNFLVVGFGFVFTAAQYDQFRAGEPWDYVAGSPDEGGHYIVNTGDAKPNDNGFINWGCRTSVTDSLIEHQGDEAWAVVSDDELRAGKTVRGFDLSGVEAALRQLR